jgi:hypothetical protein
MMRWAHTIHIGDQMHEDDFEPSLKSQMEIERDPLIIGVGRVIGWLMVAFIAIGIILLWRMG